jgi:hypothetical protein
MLYQSACHCGAEGGTNASYQILLRIRPGVMHFFDICNYFAQRMRLVPKAGGDDGAQRFNVCQLDFSIRDKLGISFHSGIGFLPGLRFLFWLYGPKMPLKPPAE